MADASPFITPDNFNTTLSTADEMAFRNWLVQNNIPFDPDAMTTDYDMRGFYSGLIGGNPHAQTAINTNDNRLHFPDFWKTPQHHSFSNESRYAGPDAPQWINDSQLGFPNGRVVFDEQSPQNLSRLLSAGPTTKPNPLALARVLTK